MIKQKSNYRDFNVPKYNRCPYCAKLKVVYWEIDHIIPLSKGGLNIEENLIYVCRNCNNKKNSSDLLTIFPPSQLPKFVLKKYYNSKVLCCALENEFSRIRKQEPVSFSDKEKQRILALAEEAGESFSGYVRRQIMQIVAEEEDQHRILRRGSEI